MSVAPRALIVTRPTEYDEMLARHGTRQQVGFFLEQRGRTLAELDERHSLQQAALQAVSTSVPVDWRRARLDRSDLDRFVFGPEDIVIAIGQDGLVANAAKYLDGQPVVGVNPDVDRNPGTLVRHHPKKIERVLRAIVENTATLETRAMVEVRSDDGQQLRALNEVFIGHHAHQSAKYAIEVGGKSEHHSSSGILVGTGTGATGWCASVHRERNLDWDLPAQKSEEMAWFVREAWPSKWTGTTLTSGRLDSGELVVRCECDRLVAFGDGIERDYIDIAWGQKITIGLAAQRLLLA